MGKPMKLMYHSHRLPNATLLRSLRWLNCHRMKESYKGLRSVVMKERRQSTCSPNFFRSFCKIE